jgi:hypothetical protein
MSGVVPIILSCRFDDSTAEVDDEAESVVTAGY